MGHNPKEVREDFGRLLEKVDFCPECRDLKIMNLIKGFYLDPALKPELSARAVLVADKKTKTIIFGQNLDKKLYPASTTKIITAITAKRLMPMDQVVTVKRVVSEGRVMGLVEGEKITVENLIYGSLIHSANDAAFALADAYGYEKFIKEMNKVAKDLGMENTQFVNPAGFDDPKHYSTAFDLYIASLVLLEDDFFRKVIGLKNITVSDVSYTYFHRLENVNKLLGELPGVAGIKTGYTELAGENLISLYKSYFGNEFILVVLGSKDRFYDTTILINWINSGLKEYKLNLDI